MKKVDYNSAERIAVPKGKDNAKTRIAFEETTEIEIPKFANGKYSAQAGGKTFFLLKAVDIPARVTEGVVDLGVCGSDNVYDSISLEKLKWEEIGEAVCRFSVLTPQTVARSFQDFMSVERRYDVPLIWLPTSKPRLLDVMSRLRDYPFRPSPLPINGSVEAYVDLFDVSAVADIVETGETAEANGLSEAFKICDVLPVMLTKT